MISKFATITVDKDKYPGLASTPHQHEQQLRDHPRDQQVRDDRKYIMTSEYVNIAVDKAKYNMGCAQLEGFHPRDTRASSSFSGH